MLQRLRFGLRGQGEEIVAQRIGVERRRRSPAELRCWRQRVLLRRGWGVTLGVWVWPLVVKDIAVRGGCGCRRRLRVATIVAIAGARTGSKSRSLRRGASILVFNVGVGVARAQASAA